jgi:serine/threonine protein kinase
MGEVYRARDRKLDRDVALKVLPIAVAQDPERLARFEREAKSLAALNHPNIAQIYAVEDNAIVMELVPGAPLHGPLPVETALEYAKQIASALEAAHERGIIHRDLKPGNAMVTPDGIVKVLDFGLAGRAGTDTSVSPDLSPTLTVRATQAGVIIGTAAYMSPEQAAGKAVDKRADIWSFGAILWELLVGGRLFDGETVSHTLADVLRAEIDFTKLPRGTPSSIRQLLGRCLDRDVKSRLRDIGEARVTIEKYLNGPKTPSAELTGSEPRVAQRHTWLAWGVAAIAIAAAVMLAVIHFRERPSVSSSIRFHVMPPDGSPFVSSIVLSPDGERFAFTASGPDGRPVLWLQSLNSLHARQVPGTEGASPSSFWSPDSRYIVFGVNGFPGRLKRVDVAGGPPQTLADYRGAFRGGDWNVSGDIVFGTGNGIWHVSGAGGAPRQLTTLNPARQEGQHAGPSFLPGERTFVYLRASELDDMRGLYVGALELAPDAQSKTRLVAADSAPLFISAPGGAGHVFFLQQRTLVAQALDERARLAATAIPVADNVGNTSTFGWFSASATGVLAYRTGRDANPTSQLVWLDRKGTRLGQLGPAMEIGAAGVSLSADGKRVAITRTDPSAALVGGAGGLPGSHIWVADVSRGIFSRLSADQASQTSHVMTPDGRVVFSTTLNAGIGDLYWTPATGVGMPEPLMTKSPTVKHPNGVSPDGRFLIYDDHTSQRQDLWILPLGPPASGERKPIPFLVTAADETFGQFSPDGRWIAYDSDESGTREVYVQGFAPDRVPAAAVGKWQISTAGGEKPRWSRDGKELYYLSLDRKLMAVPVKAGSTFEPGLAVPLFETRVASFFPYEVAADGKFLINMPIEAPLATASPVTMVLNWPAAVAK